MLIGILLWVPVGSANRTPSAVAITRTSPSSGVPFPRPITTARAIMQRSSNNSGFCIVLAFQGSNTAAAMTMRMINARGSSDRRREINTSRKGVTLRLLLFANHIDPAQVPCHSSIASIGACHP